LLRPRLRAHVIGSFWRARERIELGVVRATSRVAIVASFFEPVGSLRSGRPVHSRGARLGTFLERRTARNTPNPAEAPADAAGGTALSPSRLERRGQRRLSLAFGLTPEGTAETEADFLTHSRSARAAIAALIASTTGAKAAERREGSAFHDEEEI